MESSIRLKKYFLVSFVVSLSISALLGIIVFLVGNFSGIQGRILLTTLAIGLFSLTGLCCANLLEQKRFSAFAIFGMITSILGFLLVTSFIWQIFRDSINFILYNSVVVAIILAFSTAHVSLLLLIKSDKPIVNVSLATTILFVFLTSLEAIILVLGNFHNIDNIWYRILGILAILAVLGTIVTPLLLKITSLHEENKQFNNSLKSKF